jgi:hypothetical protein
VSNNTKILFNTFLKLDFRDTENSAKKKFIGIVISYIFANAVLSLNSFLSYEKSSYELLSFSTGVFLLVFVVLNDFGNLFFLKNHIDDLSPLPVSISELAFSKFSSALIFLSVYALVIILPQSVFFYYYDKNVFELISFIVVNVSSLFFMMGIILLLYTISLRIFSSKAGFVIYILQFFFFFYVIFVSSRISHKAIVKGDLMNSEFIRYIPQYYFTLAVNNYILFICLVSGTILIYYVYFIYLKKNYSILSSIIYTLKEKPKKEKNSKNLYESYNGFICNIFVKENQEKASYLLTANLLRSSKSMRMKIIPLTFLPLIVSLIAVFTDTLMFEPSGKISIPMLTPSVFFMLLMSVKLLISATKIEDENSTGASWIFSALPVSSVKRILNANIKFIFANFAVPILIILYAVMIFKTDVIALTSNMFFVFSASYFVITVFFAFDRVMPYSLENTKYNSASKFGEILLIMLTGIVIFVSQIFIFENVIFVIIAIIMFFVISLVIKKKQFTLKVIK